MPAPGRLALLLLLAPACFRDTPPPELSATSSETDAASSSTGVPGTGTGTTTGATTGSTTGVDMDTSGTGCPTTPWYLDADMDGHGDPGAMMLACSQPPGHVELGDDCDDRNGARAPGLLELCDGQDNDCDPLVDEYSEKNPSCMDCELAASGASSYAYCQFERTWMDARIECKKRGGDLVVIEDKAENEALAQRAVALQGQASQWYFGLNDLQQEGAFVWLDGDPVGMTFWLPGEPNGDAEENCGVLLVGSKSWNDGACDIAAFFICELPNEP